MLDATVFLRFESLIQDDHVHAFVSRRQGQKQNNYQTILRMQNARDNEGLGEFGALELYEGDSLPLKDFLRKKVRALESQNQVSAFVVADLGEVYRKLEDWKRLLPRVEPFYALKCNAHPEVSRFLADAGVGFDCASKAEIQQILGHGVHPSRIVYANPFKQSNYLTYAASNNVDLMTFDDIHELDKIKQYYPKARLLLRMANRNKVKVIHNFNGKYGCPLKQCRLLLSQAMAMKLNVVGVSFHVGCLAERADCFMYAIEDAHSVFKMGRALGFNMDILDVGGGFPGNDEGTMTFAKTAKVVNRSLDKYFPASDGVRVIAEPGRYFVTTAFTFVVNIIAKKVNQLENVDDDNTDVEIPVPPSKRFDKNNESNREYCRGHNYLTTEDSMLHIYIVNQGVYGIFGNVRENHAKLSPKILQKGDQTDSEMSHFRRSKIFGPTCAPCDCLLQECRLPEMHVGQWIYFCNMGAYSLSLASGFNGIELPIVFLVCSRDYWHKVYPVADSSSPDLKKTGGM